MRKGLTLYILIGVILLISFYYPEEKVKQASMIPNVDVVSLAPASIRTYDYFIEAGKNNGIPKKIVLGVLRKETGFNGPLDFFYNPYQKSSCDALGPGQIKLSSAREALNNPQLTKDGVLYNIKINADASMKYLKLQYDKYGNWSEALGFYHNGYRCVDSYAMNIVK